VRVIGDGGDLPWHEVGVVLHLGGEHDIAGAQVGGAPALRDEIDGFRGAAREDDLGRVGGVEEFCGADAGGLVAVGRAHRERVQAAVDVAVVALVEARDRVNHHPGLVRGRGVVEVDERLAARDRLVEGGKFRADAGEIGGHGG
jgi:hypothetical protein